MFSTHYVIQKKKKGYNHDDTGDKIFKATQTVNKKKDTLFFTQLSEEDVCHCQIFFFKCT